MRSVKAKTAVSSRQARGGRRGKYKARAPEPRPEPRGAFNRFVAPGAMASRIPRFLRGSILLRRPMLGLTLVLVLAGCMIGIFAGGHIGKTVAGFDTMVDGALARAGFAVTPASVSLTGNQRTRADDAYNALQLTDGQSLFSVKPGDVRARLLALPWVSDAVVRRVFPNAVAVKLFEKRPFALWKNGNGLVVVERSGAKIAAADVAAFPHLTILLGEGAPEAAAPLVDALGTKRAIEARLRAAERIGGRRWDLILSGGVSVKLPEIGWERELGELERLIVDKGVLERDIEMIDLRYPDNYIFRLHNGDSHPVPRERHA
jgi:cell division protein FtsQ